jgi:prevent-host-death family protein
MSRYLREVKRGTEVEILDRGQPVARLVGVSKLERRDALARMAADGLVKLGNGNAAALAEKPRASLGTLRLLEDTSHPSKGRA